MSVNRKLKAVFSEVYWVWLPASLRSAR